MTKPLTPEQFEALRTWIDARIAISRLVSGRGNDPDFIRGRNRDLRAADEEAWAVLVDTDSDLPKDYDTNQP